MTDDLNGKVGWGNFINSLLVVAAGILAVSAFVLSQHAMNPHDGAARIETVTVIQSDVREIKSAIKPMASDIAIIKTKLEARLPATE